MMQNNTFSMRGDQVEVSGTPLREFSGHLSDIKFEGSSYGNTTATKVTFEFTHVNVIKSIVPYEFPTASFAMKHSKHPSSPCAKLNKSTQELGWGDTMDLIGKTIYMEATEEHSIIDEKEAVWLTWRVISVEGIEDVSEKINLNDKVLELINGKTEKEAAQAFVQDDSLKSLQNSMFDGSLIEGLKMQGKLEVDADERYVITQ